MQTKLLINGKLVAGEGRSEDVLNPATGEVLVASAEASRGSRSTRGGAPPTSVRRLGAHRAEGPRRAAAEARRADRGRRRPTSRGWSRRTAASRTPPRSNDEIPAVADVFRFFAGARAHDDRRRSRANTWPGYTSMIRRDPMGVVASIAPWNYPLMMAAWKLAPALAAGNTVVLKPSEQTPLTALKLAELLAELFPPGVVNIVTGRGESVGAPLIAQPQVRDDLADRRCRDGRKDPAGGRQRRIKRTHLELGGKAPVIVFDDADVERGRGGVRTFGYLQRRPGLHGRVPHLRRRRRSTTGWSRISTARPARSRSAGRTRRASRWGR